MVMQNYQDQERFVYISDNPKKDFKAVAELGWTGIRFKNPVGIYRDFENDTDYEVESREDIIDILRKLDNE
jgi:putative hydrolase of the HAD superfamily